MSAGNARSSAVMTDFDGTLSEIVDDPALARPLPEATEALNALAPVFGVVAVVSGRPLKFLRDSFPALDPAVRLVGMYGMERLEHGVVRLATGVDSWRGVVAQVAGEARAQVRGGVLVEDKGLSVTLHWRTSPAGMPWADGFARRVASKTGLKIQPGRMAVELRPPVGPDKGAVVEELASGCTAACFVGDDEGDLAAFAALDRLAAGGARVVKVAVGAVDSPTALLAAADLVLESPRATVEFLKGLARTGRIAPEEAG